MSTIEERAREEIRNALYSWTGACADSPIFMDLEKILEPYFIGFVKAEADKARERALDAAYDRINTLGEPNPTNEHDVGYCNAINSSLSIIEEMGGMDPMHRKAISGGKV